MTNLCQRSCACEACMMLSVISKPAMTVSYTFGLYKYCTVSVCIFWLRICLSQRKCWMKRCCWLVGSGCENECQYRGGEAADRDEVAGVSPSTIILGDIRRKQPQSWFCWKRIILVMVREQMEGAEHRKSCSRLSPSRPSVRNSFVCARLYWVVWALIDTSID